MQRVVKRIANRSFSFKNALLCGFQSKTPINFCEISNNEFSKLCSMSQFRNMEICPNNFVVNNIRSLSTDNNDTKNSKRRLICYSLIILASLYTVFHAYEKMRRKRRRDEVLKILTSPNHIQGYLWDFDDTLVDSDAKLVKASLKMVQEKYVPTLDKLSWKNIKVGYGLWSHNMIFDERVSYFYDAYKEDILKNTGESKEEAHKFMHNFLVGLYKTNVEFFPHSKEICCLLKKRNPKSKFVIVSNRKRACVISVRQHRFNYRKFFDDILTFEDFNGKPKPNPYPYLKAAKNVNVDPSKCVVFEDTGVGVEAGKKAGCFVVGILNGYNKKKKLKHADVVISMKDLLEIIKNEKK